MADFAAMIEKERQRLALLMDDIRARRRALDDEAAAVDREMKAITAYESAKTGKQKSGGGRRSSRQDGILQLLKSAKGGMSRGAILEGLGLKGNKSGEQSVSNALNNMKKAGKVGSKDGKYVLA